MVETKRLIIKPLSSIELQKLIASPLELATDLKVTLSKVMFDKEMLDAIQNDLLPHIEKNVLFYTMWIITEKNNNAVIGGICFHGEPNEWGEVEIGYGIDEAYRSQGYMTETIAGLITWLKNYSTVTLIKAETDIHNIASCKVLENNAFQIQQQNNDSIIYVLPIK